MIRQSKCLNISVKYNISMKNNLYIFDTWECTFFFYKIRLKICIIINFITTQCIENKYIQGLLSL